MNPLKVAAAVAVCALLFRIGLRLARAAVDRGIAGRRADERRVGEEERKAQAGAGAVP